MPFVVHFTGMPGSGKGTQSDKLVKNLNFKHFSVGQLMRDEVAAGTELGKKLEIINQGKIAPSELTMQVIKKHVTNPEFKYVVLDGFPRTVEQAKMYNEVVGPADLTLIFDLEEDECMRRLEKRALENTRADDKKEIQLARFKEFYEKTAPAIGFVKDNTKYVIIDGSGSVDDVWKRVEAALKPLM